MNCKIPYWKPHDVCEIRRLTTCNFPVWFSNASILFYNIDWYPILYYYYTWNSTFMYRFSLVSSTFNHIPVLVHTFNQPTNQSNPINIHNKALIMTHEFDPRIKYVHKLCIFNRWTVFIILSIFILTLRCRRSAGYDDDDMFFGRTQLIRVQYSRYYMKIMV